MYYKKRKKSGDRISQRSIWEEWNGDFAKKFGTKVSAKRGGLCMNRLDRQRDKRKWCVNKTQPVIDGMGIEGKGI